MKSWLPNWDALLIAAIVLLAGVCAQLQQRATAQEAEAGKVVTIAPGGDAIDMEPQTRIVAEPAYWIGVRGRSIESEVLRTHLQLAEDMGVVVEDVIADSPAAKAGLRKHDIILRANGDAVDNMQVLQSQVRIGGEQPLELKIIRLGKHEKIVIVPELRPAGFQEPTATLGGFDRRPDLDVVEQLMQQFGARNIGPGMVFRGGGRAFDWNQFPSGVSVSIQRNNDGPAQITVKKGDTTWQIEGDNEESLKQLPADVQPFVERMLNGGNAFLEFGGGAVDFGDINVDFGDINAELERLLPRGLGRFGRGAERPDRLRERQTHEMDLQERMEQLEQRLRELQGKLSDEDSVVPSK